MKSTKTEPPIQRPAGVDKRWQEKVEIAKQAREQVSPASSMGPLSGEFRQRDGTTFG